MDQRHQGRRRRGMGDILHDIIEGDTIGVKRFAFVDLAFALEERRISPHDLLRSNVIPLFVKNAAVDQPPSLSEKTLEALRECLTLLTRTILLNTARSRDWVCDKMSADLIRTLIDHVALSDWQGCVPAVDCLSAIAQFSPRMRRRVAEESGMPRVYLSRQTDKTSGVEVFGGIAALWRFLYDLDHDEPQTAAWRDVHEDYQFCALGMFYKLSQLEVSMDFQLLNPAQLMPVVVLALPGWYLDDSSLMGCTVFRRCLREWNPGDFRDEILKASVLMLLENLLANPDSDVVVAALECIGCCGQSHPKLNEEILKSTIPASLIRLVRRLSAPVAAAPVAAAPPAPVVGAPVAPVAAAPPAPVVGAPVVGAPVVAAPPAPAVAAPVVAGPVAAAPVVAGPLVAVCETVHSLILGGKVDAIQKLADKGVLDEIYGVLRSDPRYEAACAALLSVIEFGNDQQKGLFLTRNEVIEGFRYILESTQHPLHLYDALRYMKRLMDTADRLGHGLLVQQIIERRSVRRKIKAIRKSDDKILSSLAHEIKYRMDNW